MGRSLGPGTRRGREGPVPGAGTHPRPRAGGAPGVGRQATGHHEGRIRGLHFARNQVTLGVHRLWET